MTLLFWILTAICFVGWIWQGVCTSVVRRGRDQAKSSYEEMRTERDQAKSSYEEMRTGRDYYRGNLGQSETWCNEVAGERDEVAGERDELKGECDELRETLARVAEAVAIEREAGKSVRELRARFDKRLNETTIPFLDGVIAEYGTAATDESEE